MDVAIAGGTGNEGFGLALRLATAGHRVAIGSRDADKVQVMRRFAVYHGGRFREGLARSRCLMIPHVT